MIVELKTWNLVGPDIVLSSDRVQYHCLHRMSHPDLYILVGGWIYLCRALGAHTYDGCFGVSYQGLASVGVGDLVRDQVKQGTATGKEIKVCTRRFITVVRSFRGYKYVLRSYCKEYQS